MSDIDALYIPYALFMLGIIAVIGYYVLSSICASQPFASVAEVQGVCTNALNSWSLWDEAYIAIVVLLALVAVVLAWVVPMSPIFFIVEIITLIVAVFIAPQYSNMYQALATQPTLASSANNFPQIAYIMGNMPAITLIISGLIAIAGYGKNNTRGIRGL